MASIVFLVEDDETVRDWIVEALERADIAVRAYESPTSFLTDYDAEQPGCLVLDVQTAGLDAVDLYRLITKGRDGRAIRHPFIVISGDASVAAIKEAIRLGAIDFLQKPFDADVLLSKVGEAFTEDASRREERERHASVQRRLDSLTSRQRQVLDLVVGGKLTKQIARELGVTVKTIESHRSIATKKMGCESVAQLVRLMTEHNIRIDAERRRG